MRVLELQMTQQVPDLERLGRPFMARDGRESQAAGSLTYVCRLRGRVLTPLQFVCTDSRANSRFARFAGFTSAYALASGLNRS